MKRAKVLFILALVTTVALGLTLATRSFAADNCAGGDKYGIFATACNGGISGKVGGATTIEGIVAGAISLGLEFLGVLFFFLVLYGGYTWMTAFGNTEKIDKAKSILESAAIGLCLVLASYAIARVVFDSLTNGVSQTSGPQQCATDADCNGGTCNGGFCAVGQPNNGVKLPTNGACQQNSDCASNICSKNLCAIVAPSSHCSNNKKDADESDVDCGGMDCDHCAVGHACKSGLDCISADCRPVQGQGKCFPQDMSATCNDGINNGKETDIDCGGGDCPGCKAGSACLQNTDCQSNNCDGGKGTCL